MERDKIVESDVSDEDDAGGGAETASGILGPKGNWNARIAALWEATTTTAPIQNDLTMKGDVVVFLVGARGERIEAHKFVLAMRSTVFCKLFYGRGREVEELQMTCRSQRSQSRGMLSRGSKSVSSSSAVDVSHLFVQQQQNPVMIEDVSVEVFRRMLKFVYTDQIDVEGMSRDGIRSLLLAAAKYGVGDLQKQLVSVNISMSQSQNRGSQERDGSGNSVGVKLKVSPSPRQHRQSQDLNAVLMSPDNEHVPSITFSQTIFGSPICSPEVEADIFAPSDSIASSGLVSKDNGSEVADLNSADSKRLTNEANLQEILTLSQTRARKKVSTQPKKLRESSTGSVKRRVRQESMGDSSTPKKKKIIKSPVQTPSSSNKSSNSVEKSFKTESRVSRYSFSDMELSSSGSSSSPSSIWKKQPKTLANLSPVSKKCKGNTPKAETLKPCRKKEKVTLKVDQVTPSCSTSCLNPSSSNINREDTRCTISEVQLQYPFEQFYSDGVFELDCAKQGLLRYAEFISSVSKQRDIRSISICNMDIAEAYLTRREKFEKVIVPDLTDFTVNIRLQSVSELNVSKFVKMFNVEEYLFFICTCDINSEFVNTITSSIRTNIRVNGRNILQTLPAQQSILTAFSSRSKDVVENLSKNKVIRKLAIGFCSFPKEIDHLACPSLRKLAISRCTISVSGPRNERPHYKMLREATKLENLVVTGLTSMTLHIMNDLKCQKTLKELVVSAAVIRFTVKNVTSSCFPVLEKLVMFDCDYDPKTTEPNLARIFPHVKEVAFMGENVKISQRLVSFLVDLEFIQKVEVWNMNTDADEDFDDEKIKIRLRSIGVVETLSNFLLEKNDLDVWTVTKLRQSEFLERKFRLLKMDLFFSDREVYKIYDDPTAVEKD